MKNRKNGVAVIIVLGLLALLMVLGVAFSVSMRVERAGAANYASTARTRQIIWAGLARAIGNINETTSGMFPDGDYLVSGAAGWVTNVTGGVRLLTGTARDHVPDLYLGYDSLRARWLPLGVGDDREGYAAYVVLNLSDMLDANYVGGAPREGGTNAAEVVLAPTLMTTGERDELIAKRASHGLFETLPELRVEAPGVPTDSLAVYSRYLADADCINAVNIGGDVDDLLANEDEIVAAIRVMAESGGQGSLSMKSARAVFTNLLDYIDEDSIPRNLMGPNTEAVPMLNEIAVTNVILNPSSGSILSAVAVRGDIETWYPFLEKNRAGLNFRVQGNYQFNVTITQPGGSGLADASVSSNGTFSSAQDLDYRNREFPLHNPFFVAGALMPGGSVAVTNTSDISISLSISNLTVFATGSGDVVDRVDGVFAFSGSGQFGSFPGITSDKSYEVYDPRYNWLDVVPYWNPQATDSIGKTNSATLALLANPAMAGMVERGGFKLHVSDRGHLFSPLEFGYLPRTDQPSSILQTFRVFDQDNAGPLKRHQILENFKVKDTSASRGLVNANTLYVEMLEPAFRDMPYQYVGGPTIPVVSVTNLTDMIIAASASVKGFASLTDILDLDWQGALPDISDAEREAIAAYSTGLMGVRQNLFLIVVAASAGGEGMGRDEKDTVSFRGRQRALALVWRDPVANAEGLHDCFVRHFQWLD